MIAQASRDYFHMVDFLGFVAANDVNQSLGFARNSRGASPTFPVMARQ